MLDHLTKVRKAEFIRALQFSGLLFFAFLVVTEQLLTRGPLYRFDHYIKGLRHHTFRGLSSHLLIAMDDLGLRGFTATVLILTALAIGYRFKSWRPLNLSILSLLLLNGVVGISKLLFGRAKPRLGFDELHVGGLSYPSGHSSNALLTWGLVAYLIFRYTNKRPFTGLRLFPLVYLITLIVCIVSLLRDTHWFSDLIAGVFMGGSLLVFVIAIDRLIPSKKQPS